MKCSQCAMQCRLAWSLFLMELVLSIASCDLHVITVVLGRPATEQNSAKPVERSYPASLQVTSTIASHPCKENSPRSGSVIITPHLLLFPFLRADGVTSSLPGTTWQASTPTPNQTLLATILLVTLLSDLLPSLS